MRNIHLMKLKTSEIIEQSFRDLRVTDIVDFKSLNVVPKITELQNYFDKHRDSIYLDNDAFFLPISSAPSILNNSSSEQVKDNLIIYLDKELKNDYHIANISVKYDEDYEYGVFDEYNLDADTIKSIHEYENVEECLSSQNECSNIENYSYSIYLEISLKECA